MREDAARRARRDVARLAHSGLDWVAFARQVEEVVRKAIPFGPSCWHTLDPATLVLTGAVARDLGEEPRLPYHEYAIPDVNKWAYLAKSRRPIGTLTEATHGHEESSPRFRELLRPRGITREMRGALSSDGSAWGSFGLFRTGAQPNFDRAEESLLEELAPVLADGLRRALLLTAELPLDTPGAPGIVVFDDRGEIEAMSGDARRWMQELVNEDVGEEGFGFPYPLHAVALRARHAGNEGAAELSARARAYTRSGRWLTLFGTRMQTPAGERVAVIIEPARPHEIAPVIVRAYGLSEREREVAQLCLHGASTATIASRLHLSPYTVQDYLKSIFEKTGVRSRRELVAKIFNEHYWPAGREVEGLDDDAWSGVEFRVARAGS